MPSATITWNRNLVVDEQKAIKARLDEILKQGNESKRLHHILEEIRNLEDSPSSLDQLRRYIFVMSALVHHERYGGLTPQSIRRLASLGEAILQTQHIKPQSSSLAHLFGDLHLVLSQIFRKSGNHWLSAWEQQLSVYLSQNLSSTVKGFQSLGLGLRAVRLGHSQLALGNFTAAETNPINPRVFARARIERLRTLRFAGQLEEANRLSDTSLDLPDITEDERHEILWERLCRQAQSSQDLASLIASIRRKKIHHHSPYILEAFFWIRSVSSRRWLAHFPTLRALTRDRSLKHHHQGAFYKCAMILDRCYDVRIPFNIRLQQIGKIISRVNGLVTVDQELLVWAASARWLSRNRSYSLAALALSEYQGLSLRLSAGKQDDVLGLIADLIRKPWFTDLLQGSLSDDKPIPIAEVA